MSYTKALNYYFEFDPYKQKIQPNDQAQIVANLKLITLTTDEVFYTSKTPAQFYYFITQGSLSLEMSNGKTITLSAGQYFGEEAVLGLEFYISKAVAQEVTQLIQFSAQDFQELLPKNDALRQQIVINYTHKLTLDPLGGTDKSSRSISKATSSSFSLSSSASSTRNWILSLIIPLFIYVILPKIGLEENARLFLTFLSSAFCLWSFSLIPPYLSALLVIMSSLALELAPRQIILSSFATDHFLMLFSIFALGCALAQSTILYRMMLLILKFMPPTHFWTNTSVFILGAIYTPFVPSTRSRQAIFQKFTKNIIQQISLTPTSATTTKLALVSYTGATLLSPIFLTGSLYNFFILDFLNANQDRFQWLEWLTYATPTLLLLCAGLALVLSLFFKEDEKPTPFRERVETQLYLLKDMKSKDRGLIFLTGAYLLGLISIHYHGLSTVCVSLIMIICLVIFDFISVEKLRSNLNWPSLFLFAFLGSLVSIFNYLELSKPMISAFKPLAQVFGNDFTSFAFLLGLLLMISRIVLPYGIVVVIAATIFIPLGQQHGFHPWLIGFLILLFAKDSLVPTSSSCLQNFMTPFFQNEDHQRTTVWKYHLIINLIKFSAVYFSISFWKGMSLV